MANPSVTYTFTNGTTADGTQVSQNFTDLINGLTDGTKSLNIDAITAAGTATFNGNTVIGNTSGDTSTVNAVMSFATTPLADVINEKTSTAGTVIKGRTSGTAIAAGYVGEIFAATTYSGTGGATYATDSNIVATHTNPATLLTLTLKKGVYLFGCTILQAKATDASLPELSISIKIGGTVVSESSRSQFSASTDSYTTNRKTLPIVITTDDTAVVVTGTMVIVNADARLAKNECWAIRIG